MLVMVLGLTDCVITEEDTTKGGKGTNEVGLDGDGSLDARDVGRPDDGAGHLGCLCCFLKSGAFLENSLGIFCCFFT